nr:RHS repeat-associated core domain-containing protein [Stenotrophomonas maltophilia]
MRRFGGTAGGVSTRFRGFEDRIRKLGASGVWLCCVLLIGLGVSPAAIAQTTVTYIHTDALGSVVAESDASGNVIKRYDYEPYGAVVGGQVTDGPGYTGHVSDAATGLSYMQQRYMDPQLGVFLSVDPVTAYEQPVGQFNRYRYGNGNPYGYADPDGADAIYFTDVNVVVIPVYFKGAEATKENIQQIKARVDSISSEFSGMKIRLQVLSSPSGAGTNVMELGAGKNYKDFPLAGEGVDSRGGRRGYIDMSADNGIGAAAHDIIHFAGARDGYASNGSREGRTGSYLPGYSQQHIMADRRGTSLRAMDEDAIRGNDSTSRVQLGSFQGVFRVDGRLDSMRLEKNLKGK